MGAGVSAAALKQQEQQLKDLKDQTTSADKQLAKQSTILETTLKELRVLKQDLQKTPEDKKEPVVDLNIVFKVERGLKIKEGNIFELQWNNI